MRNNPNSQKAMQKNHTHNTKTRTHTHIHAKFTDILTSQTIYVVLVLCYVAHTLLFDSLLQFFFLVCYFVESHTSTIAFGKCLIYIFLNEPGHNWNLTKISLFHVISNVWTHSIVYFVCVAKRIERILSEHFYCLYGTEKSINNYCAICVNVVYERPLSFSVCNHSHAHKHTIHACICRDTRIHMHQIHKDPSVVLSVRLLFLLLLLLLQLSILAFNYSRLFFAF